MRLILHTDGGARGNPGPAGAGVVLVDADTGRAVHEAGHFLGRATNNVAEYHALLHGLEAAARLGPEHLTVRSDSELMVRQLSGRYRVKSPELRPLFERAQTLIQTLGEVAVEHVRREANARADELANLAMDRRRDVGGDAAAGTATEPDAGSEAAFCGWTVTLGGRAGACEAGNAPGTEHVLGRTTPEGLCVHAAEAALRDGPLHWPAGKASGRTRCGRCGVTLSLRRIDGAD